MVFNKVSPMRTNATRRPTVHNEGKPIRGNGVEDRFHDGWKAELRESMGKKRRTAVLQMNRNRTPRADCTEPMPIITFQDKLPMAGFGRVERV